MRLTTLAALAALTLSACSQPEEPATPPPAPEPSAVLAGVDLTKPVLARGTEPFWSVELTGTEMVYAGLDRPEQRAPQVPPDERWPKGEGRAPRPRLARRSAPP